MVVVRSAISAVLLTDTVALGTTPPELSVTVPVIFPVVETWAFSLWGTPREQSEPSTQAKNSEPKLDMEREVNEDTSHPLVRNCCSRSLVSPTPRDSVMQEIGSS